MQEKKDNNKNDVFQKSNQTEHFGGWQSGGVVTGMHVRKNIQEKQASKIRYILKMNMSKIFLICLSHKENSIQLHKCR